MRRVMIGLAAVTLVLVGACTLLLPERYAVNAPITHMLLGWSQPLPSEEVVASRMRVPEGFSFGVWAEGIAGARWLRFTPAGDLLVSQPRSGSVALIERDADGRAGAVKTLLSNLDRPHGMEIRDGWLYVAETGAIGRVRFDAERREVTGAFERIIQGLPQGGNHWTRTIRFGPDGALYASVGSSCNVCREEDPRRAALLRFAPDGSNPEIFATGLRNAVGFDWQPGTGALYATDNGRDLLGDTFPPGELNRIEKGGFYGWPVANGDRVPDPDLGAGQEEAIKASIPPAHPFRAHNAPLGISFLHDADIPGYRDAAFVALHGSWNRTKKDGYKVVSLHWTEGGAIEERDFLSGFLEDDDVIGRPVDVAEGPDGAIYVSDDYSGVIWRVAWGESTTSLATLPSSAPRGEDGRTLASLGDAERNSRTERGAALWSGNACAACHDPNAIELGAVLVPLDQLGSKHSIDSLELLLQTPPSPMPVPPLDDAGREDLAVYLLDRFQ